jgi:hypothetical protein
MTDLNQHLIPEDNIVEHSDILPHSRCRTNSSRIASTASARYMVNCFTHGAGHPSRRAAW